MKKTKALPVLGVLLLFGAAISVSAFLPTDTVEHSVFGDENVESGANVWIKVDRGNDGTVDETYVTHNVLMEGEEAIEDQIKSGQSVNWDNIVLGNGTTPVDGDTSLDAEITDCGLSATSGSFEDVGDGNWNLTATFTASCDNVPVNTTAQYSPGAGTSIDYFAGAYFGRTIDMYDGDSLTVEWENTVSN